MKPLDITIAVALALLVAAYMFLSLPIGQNVTQDPAFHTYASERYGISFNYPTGFIFSEDTGGTCVERHLITLIKEEDAVPVIAGGEGPVSITVSICQNEIEPVTLYEWMTTKQESNFALGDGTYASTTVDGTEALTYGWSGLYEGETTVFLHERAVVAVSATYMSPSDPIHAAYEMVIGTLQLR